MGINEIVALKSEIASLKQTIKDLEMTHEVDLANSAWREREECAKIVDEEKSRCDERAQGYLDSLPDFGEEFFAERECSAQASELSSRIRARNN